jgi:hypothetical protein
MARVRWARWSPVGGILFVALFLIGLALVSDPDSNKADAKILAHYAKAGNRHQDIAAFFLFLAGALVFVWFLSMLRERLARAEGRAGPWTAAAFGAGFAAIALWLAGFALFAAPSFARTDTSKFVLDPNTFRILNDVGYALWFSGTTVAGIIVFATAMLSRRAHILPTWLTWLSFVAWVTTLVSFFFVPFLVFLGWVLVVSALFLWRELRPASPEAAAA